MFKDVSSKHLGKSIYSQKKQKSRWNGELPVGTVNCPLEQYPLQCRYSTPATVLTKRQNTGKLHLEPCKTIF